MKQKVGELYGKPIVVGSPNEFEKYEIPLNDLGGGFDDGMEYYKINIKILENLNIDIQGVLSAFFITSIVDSKLNTGVSYNEAEFVYMCGNTKVVAYGNVTGKNYLNTQLEEYDISLNDTSIFIPITAKEYYSLLK